MNRKIDEASFRKLATKRVNCALKTMNLIANLSNKANYSYTENDVSKIIAALEGGLKEVKRRFSQKQTKKIIFKLD